MVEFSCELVLTMNVNVCTFEFTLKTDCLPRLYVWLKVYETWSIGMKRSVIVENKRIAVFTATIISVMFMCSVLSAAEWVGTSGSITNGANWDIGVVPSNIVDAAINNGGTGQFAGDTFVSQLFTLGAESGESGSLDVSGGDFTAYRMFVGNAGTGAVTQSEGDVYVTIPSSDPALGIGYDIGGVGSYLMTGGSLTLAGSGGNFQIGGRGKGTFVQSGGAVTGDSWMVIGRYGPAGDGSLTVSGGNFCQNDPNNRLIIGEGGTGVLTVTNTGVVSANGGLRIGMFKSNAGADDVGVGTGTVWLCEGGTISTPLVSTQGGGSTFNFDGGTLAARGDRQSFGSFFEGLTAANVLGGGALIDSGNNTVTINQDLQDGGGSGGLTKTGEGFLTLSGNNSYAGNTVISEGVLSAATTNALPGYNVAGKVQVADGCGLAVGTGGADEWPEAAIYSLLGSASFGTGCLFGFDTTAGDKVIDNDMTSPLGFLKMGVNTLKLEGTNAWAGGSVVYKGVLQADFGVGLPNTTNVTLKGGTLSSESGSITTALGTGSGQINIASGYDAGFSAYGTPLTVNIGGSSSTLQWGTAGFNPSILLLNEIGADNPLTFENALDIAGGERQIAVNATVANADVTLTGDITDSVSGGTLVKSGEGTLVVEGTASYNGTTYVDAGTVEMNAGAVHSLGELAVRGNGHLDVGADDITQATGNLVLYGGNTSQLTISGGSISNANNSAFIGYWASGLGSLAMSDGSLYFGNEFDLGVFAGSSGTFALSGGKVTTRYFSLGRYGNGTVTQSGGTFVQNGLYAGDGWRIGGWNDGADTGVGIYNMQGGVLDTLGHNIQIGANGSGTVNQSGGTVFCGGWPVVGRFSGGVGEYNLSGGVFNQTGSGNKFLISEYGTGTLNVNGTGVADLVGGLALSVGGAATVNLETGGTIITPKVESFGGPGSFFNFDGGTLQARGENNTYSAFMQGLTTANVKAGGAVINSSNNTITVAQNLNSGAVSDGGLTKQGSGTLILSGANSYNGTTTVDDGVLRLGSASAVTNGGDVAVTGGSFDLGGYTITNGAVAMSAGSIINGSMKADSYSLSEGTVLANLSGDASLTKSGSGMVTLCGTNTYTGDTFVEAGTLEVNSLPAHRWSFNGDLTDSIGNKDAASIGSVSLGSTQCTLAGGAKGTSYVDLGSDILPTENSPFTIEIWATQHGLQNWSRIFDFGSDTDNYIIMTWTYQTDINRDHVEVKVNGAITYQQYTMAPYTLDTEYHISMVVTPGAGSDGKTLFQWYKMDSSGNTLKSSSFSADYNLADVNQANMWLGHSEWPDNDANASYNEVRIWNSALSQTQLSENATLGPDVLPAMLDNAALPAGTDVAVDSGAVLDLGGSVQTITDLSGSGLVTNGTLGVTGTVAPGGTNNIGTLSIAASTTLSGTLLVDVAQDGTSDLLQVEGDLDVSGMTLEIEDEALLKSSEIYVLATCDPGGLTGPFISGAPNGWNVVYDSADGEIRLASLGLLIMIK